MNDLLDILGPLVEGRAFTPILPTDPRGRTMRARIACEFPAITVREMQGPARGLIQVRCHGESGANCKRLAAEVLSAMAASEYTPVEDYRFRPAASDHQTGICRLGLRFRRKEA